jgi:Xaa-Pro aminopeptidase
MARDAERVERVRMALREAGWDALVCSLPADVLLLTGYWPVVGTALAVVTREGHTALLAPEDERELAEQGGADVLRTFQPGSLKDLRNATEAVRGPLAEAVTSLRIQRGRIGYEHGGFFEPSSYASMHFYGVSVLDLLAASCPAAKPVPADELLAVLRSVKTPSEVGRIRTACRIAGHAFAEGAARLRPGLRETEAAAQFQAPLSTRGVGFEGVRRAGGFAYCMAGAHAAQAFGAYARSRHTELARGDFVLVHCNSYADGYWTDITRTYCLGGPDDRQRPLYEAVFAARAAALGAIRPGVRAAHVDGAARSVLRDHGFGDAFKHTTGHGVGFAAINHNARPRLHPKSGEVLEAGMVFNVEPAVYLDGFGGVRHCDVVAVTDHGVEVLTPFQPSPGQCVLTDPPAGGLTEGLDDAYSHGE